MHNLGTLSSSQQKSKADIRLQRIDRDHAQDVHLEDDSGHLWAVSYADLLMVLLSFFILFFSVDKKKRDDVINIIAQASVEKSGGLHASGAGKGAGLSSDSAAPHKTSEVGSANLSSKIGGQLSQYRVEVNEEKKELRLLLADNLYGKGEYVVSERLEGQLLEITRILKPYQDQIEIIFVGHTDSAPVARVKSRYLRDNFDLSALRAARALQFAQIQGMNPQAMSASAAADHRRQTRSLSVVVKERHP